MQSPGSTEGGIFSDEKVMQFFINLKILCTDCFQTLHTIAKQKATSMVKGEIHAPNYETMLHESFFKGLQYVHQWDDAIHQDEANRATQRFPTMEKDYKYTLVEYIRQTQHHSVKRVRLRMPPFKLFLYWMLRRMASNEVISKRLYFNSFNFVERDIFMRQMMRETIRECVTDETLQVVESSSQHQTKSETKSEMPSASPKSATSHPPSVTAVDKVSSLHGGGRVVRPEDSVSNVASVASVMSRNKTWGGSLKAEHLQQFSMQTLPVVEDGPEEGGEESELSQWVQAREAISVQMSVPEGGVPTESHKEAESLAGVPSVASTPPGDTEAVQTEAPLMLMPPSDALLPPH